MQLMDELVDAYLTNNMEFQFYLDLQTGQVVLELDGAAEIDWDDEENEDRYVSVLQIDSDEAYHLRVKFARSTESDPEMELFDALQGRRPFMKFKDALSDLDLWNEWNEFERDYAEQAISFWLERERVSYDQLAELFSKNQNYPL